LLIKRTATNRTIGHAEQASPIDWSCAYAQLGPALLAYLRRLSRDSDAAEELVQETFARAMAASLVPPESELRPWLYRIASNLAIDRLRRARRLRFVPFLGTESAPDPNSDEAEAVRSALRAIDPELAATLVLRLHEGFSRAEVALIRGVSERKVKSRLADARIAFERAYRGRS
jgi:RNA polymerase sigma-70 factor (ECF subfamily)